MRDILGSEVMLKCAELHYEEDLDQIEIANRLGISQSQVSKLLRKAREEGLIRVTIQRPRLTELEYRFKETFGLRDTRIILSTEDESQENDRNLMRALGVEAARYFEGVVKEGNKVGLSGGHTMYEFVNALSLPPLHLKVYPLVAWGTHHLQIKHVHASTLVSIWWYKYRDTEAYRMDVPCVNNISKIKANTIRKALEEVRDINVIITSVGHIYNTSSFVELVESLDFDITSLLNEGVIGDLIGYPITKDGREVAKEKIKNFWNLVYIPLPFSKLVQLARDPGRYVVLVAGGEKKLESIAAAIRGRLFNVLVTDSKIAQTLLEWKDRGQL
jgi:DNA-binding transcriptional regulator LsrR (DeoR family)